MAIVGNEVMLCEAGNKGTIMIYNKEVKYVRCIVHYNMGQFISLSSDCHDNLYVTDIDRSMIRVFSNDGVLLRSFACDDN